jgi:exodeoxyribonuclease-3
MRIATWNVNSIRARIARLTAWLQKHTPDVVCLQEIKAEEEDYPIAELQALGYRSRHACQRTYNGVAILAREPIENVLCELPDGVNDRQARFVAGVIRGIQIVCVYVPNGQLPGTEKYAYKLQWLERLRCWLVQNNREALPLVLCGDFNVAPDERDVHDPAAWENETLFHVDSRQAFERILAVGLVDAFRLHNPNSGFFSWWDYRMLGFPKNRGLRIDHVLMNAAAAQRCTECVIDRNERKGKLPSDHAPVVATLCA